MFTFGPWRKPSELPLRISLSESPSSKAAWRLLTCSVMHRTGHGTSFTTQINEFLARQAARMEQAVVEARQQCELEASRKRQALSDEISTSAKRRRLDLPHADAQVFATPDNPLATFDATGLPLPIVIDLIVNNFQGISDATLNSAIDVRTADHV